MADTIGELIVQINGDASGLSAAIASVEAQLSGLSSGLNSSGMSNFKRNVNNTENSLKKFGSGLDAVVKPLYTTSLALAAGGVASAKFAMDFEDNFANVTKTVSGTKAQLKEVKQGIIDLTTTGINGRNAIPQTTAQLTELAAAGGQLGIETENIVEFTEVMAQMGTATNLAGADGAAVLARFMNVTDTSQEKVRNVGSAIVDLGNNFATTESEIASLAMRMGATGQVVGISAQDILGYSTALSSMGIEAEAGGSSVSRIWMDIQSAVSSGGSELSKFADVSGKSSAEFVKQWNTNASGAFQDFVVGLSKSGDQIAVLDSLGFNNIRDIQALQRLASTKGIELMTEALSTANRAWEENIALQNEADAKAETTAGQWQITKNNIVEAARGIGETMLPTLKNASGTVKDFAQGLANMSDSGKKAVTTVGASVIAVGAVTKGVASVTKTAGNIVEGIGKIKEVKGAEGLLSLGKAGLIAAAGIAAVGTAVYVGKKAYSTWYDSNYKWTKGLSESEEVLSGHIDSLKTLNGFKSELSQARLVLNSDDSSQEEIDQAKAKIEEIKELLENEYHLVIKTDSDIDDVLDDAKGYKKNDITVSANKLNSELNSKYSKFLSYEDSYATAEREYNSAKDTYEKYGKYYTQALTLYYDKLAERISKEEYERREKELAEEVGDESFMSLDADTRRAYAMDWSKDAQKDMEKYQGEMDSLNASYKEYLAISESFANKQLELLNINTLDGDTEAAADNLDMIAAALKRCGGELDNSGYAEAAALAMNNIKSMDEAWSAGGETLDKVVSDYITVGQQFGVSAGEIALNAALIKNGFSDLSGAESSGNLGTIIEQANELGHALGLIDKDKRIEISATGDISIIDTLTGKIYDLNGKQIGVELSATDNATPNIKNVKDGIEGLPTEHDTKLTATDNASATINSVKSSILAIPSTKTVTIETKVSGGLPSPNALANGNTAKGTKNAKAGFGIINDEKGIADPTELLIRDGVGYTFSGRDVPVQFKEHDVLLTASQTKAALNSLPHYASGKNNEAWEKIEAKKFNLNMGWIDDEEYYSFLAKYRDENFKPDTEDWREATLELHKYSQQLNDDALSTSESWIELRNTFNDWDEINETPFDAYTRIVERQNIALSEGIITADEYAKTVSDSFENIISGRREYSFDWLDHEKKYNALDVDGSIDGLKRVQAYTDEYFSNLGDLTEEQYAVKITLDKELLDKMYDEYSEKVSAWEEDKDWYQKQAEAYGWDSFGDTETDFWERTIGKYTAFANDENLSATDRLSAARKADEARLSLYKSIKNSYDEQLNSYKEYMDEIQDTLDKRLDDLETSWEIEDRAEDKADAFADIKKFENAVTLEGKEKYQDALDRYKELDREDQRYALEVANNAIMEGLQENYEAIEKEKQKVLEQTKEANMKCASVIQSINASVDSMQTNFIDKIENLADVLKTEVEKLKPVTVNQTNYQYINDKTMAEMYSTSAANAIFAAIGG